MLLRCHQILGLSTNLSRVRAVYRRKTPRTSYNFNAYLLTTNTDWRTILPLLPTAFMINSGIWHPQSYPLRLTIANIFEFPIVLLKLGFPMTILFCKQTIIPNWFFPNGRKYFSPFLESLCESMNARCVWTRILMPLINFHISIGTKRSASPKYHDICNIFSMGDFRWLWLRLRVKLIDDFDAGIRNMAASQTPDRDGANCSC